MVQSLTGPFRAIVLTMAFCSMGLLFWLTRSYQNTRPTTPNELVGAIYPEDEQGRIVYLTSAEHQEFIAAQAFVVAMVVCVAAVEIRRQSPRLKQILLSFRSSG
jgi:hypothetical protein